MQRGKIATHPCTHTVGLRIRGVQQRWNAPGDDIAHRQVVVGDHIQPALRLGHVMLRPGHLDPADLGMRRGQHLREPVEREGERAFLAGQPAVCGKGLQVVVEEHLVGDDGDATLAAQGDQGLTLGVLDV